MIRAELAVQLRRPGYWAVLGAVAVVAVVVAAIIAATSGATPERLGDHGSVIPDSSGLTMGPLALNSLLLFLLPLAVAVYAGEAVAGEASWGSLRYRLARPVSRRRVLGAKVAVAGLFSVAAVGVGMVAGLAAGLAAFGWHPLSVIDLQHASPFASGATTFSPPAALGRVALAGGVVTVTMVAAFAFAVLCSTLTDSPLVAVAGGVGLTLVSRALDNIPGLHALSPWLPATDQGTGLWTELLFRPSDTSGYPHLFGVQAAYAVVFLAAAAVWFSRKDVLS